MLNAESSLLKPIDKGSKIIDFKKKLSSQMELLFKSCFSYQTFIFFVF
jgi:hypothetical protein